MVWASPVKVAVSGNTITKNAGCAAVSFTGSAGAQMTVGLSTGHGGTGGVEITFGLRFYPGYVESVSEAGRPARVPGARLQRAEESRQLRAGRPARFARFHGHF